jgi:hypothetical protein
VTEAGNAQFKMQNAKCKMQTPARATQADLKVGLSKLPAVCILNFEF